jgi:hypothetical protein
MPERCVKKMKAYKLLTIRDVAQKMNLKETYIRKKKIWEKWPQYGVSIIRINEGGDIRFVDYEIDDMILNRWAINK